LEHACCLVDGICILRGHPTSASAWRVKNARMNQSSPWPVALREAAVSGSLASVLSTAALALASRYEVGRPFAGTNAVSHWLWGDEALRRNEADWRHTGVGYATHHGASVFWALLYSRLYGHRPEAHRPARAAAGALATAAISCLVDFRFTPQRLTPGFEHRLSKKALALVYGAFAAGLFLGALATRKPPRGGGPSR
jgi:hypothetical protein